MMDDLTRLILRLYIRNSRTRHIIITPIFNSLFGMSFFIVGVKTNSLTYSIMGLIISVLSTGTLLNVHFFRVISADFDRLMSFPLQESDLIRSASKISIGVTVFLLILNCTFSLVFSPITDVMYLFSGYIFALGLLNYLFLYAGICEEKRFDYALSSFSTKGAVVSHPLVKFLAIFICTVTILSLYLIEYYFNIKYLFVGVTLIFGIGGIFSFNVIQQYLSSFLKTKLYKMKTGFRLK